jgi:nucleoside-diphosphate-sugar epimerase
LWGEDFNVAAENPYNTHEIVEKMSSFVGRDLEEILVWHPETDYLGNHILSSEKFRNVSGWKPRVSLESGVRDSWKTLVQRPDDGYNPLKHLDDAREKGIDLTAYY